MSQIAQNLTDLIGNTPLLELANYNRSVGLTPGWSPSWNTSILPEVLRTGSGMQ